MANQSNPLSLRDLERLSAAFPASPRMPILFVGHGSPMNAIENNIFSAAWESRGQALPRPAAIVVISAHWLTHGTYIAAMPKPRTIYDFGGFPPELFAQKYPAPGSPELAEYLHSQLDSIKLDHDWGLDHGAWSILIRMFPQADIPVLQLSIDWDQDGAALYRLAGLLRRLRERSVLFIGSGNVVHNLREVIFDSDRQFDWAVEFESKVMELVDARRHTELQNWRNLGPSAHKSIPTDDHYRPLLAILGLSEPDEPITYFNQGVTMGSLSMLSLQIG